MPIITPQMPTDVRGPTFSGNEGGLHALLGGLQAGTKVGDALMNDQSKLQAAGLKLQSMLANKQQHQQEVGAKVVGDAQKQYQKNSSKIQDEVSAIGDGLDALKNNDSNAAGVIFPAIMGSKDFKRFNTPEQRKLLPTSVQEQISEKLTQFGFDPKSFNGEGGLNDIQRSQLSKVLQSRLNQLQDQHEAIKQNALQMIQQNPYADQSKAAGLGDPLSNRISKLSSGYQDFSKEIGSSLEKGQAAAPKTPSQAGEDFANKTIIPAGKFLGGIGSGIMNALMGGFKPIPQGLVPKPQQAQNLQQLLKPSLPINDQP